MNRRLLVASVGCAVFIACALLAIPMLSGDSGIDFVPTSKLEDVSIHADTNSVRQPAGDRESLNDYILRRTRTFPTDGTFPALYGTDAAKNSGVSRNISFAGRVWCSPREDHKVSCIGLIFDVTIGALEDYAAAHGTKLEEVTGLEKPGAFKSFRRSFYGVDGNRWTFVRALRDANLGVIVPLAQSRPGDLVQFWRNSGSGHAVVLMKVNYTPDGIPDSLSYWSVQRNTGIAYNSERFGSEPGQIDASSVFIVRASVPSDTQPPTSH